MAKKATAKPVNADKAEAGLKVFISYSRSEVHFADELELFLSHSGFEPLIDRHGIDAGEDWKKRLGDLILACDTVVFVLSDTSAASPICKWEVEEAARHGKRMLVVTLGPTAPGLAPPVQLAGINWISCWANPALPGSSQTRGFYDLSEALRTDLGWLRQMTDLQAQAVKWAGRGAGEDSPHLLRADVLSEAIAWARAAPDGHEIPEVVSRFLAASEAHERRQTSKALSQARAVRRTGFIGAGVAAVFLVAALGLGWLALRQTEAAQQQTALALAQSSAILARESEAIYEGEQGDHTRSLLMGLQADPLARNTAAVVPEKFAPKDGYAFAQARLQAAHENNRVKHVIEGHDDTVTSAAFSPDGQWIVTGSWDNTARIWNAKTGDAVRALEGHDRMVTSAVFSPDGNWIVTGSFDNTARIWNAETGDTVRTLEGHDGTVTSAAFSPDGQWIVTASYDSTARIWNAETGDAVRTLENYDQPVNFAAFSPDGQRIATGSEDYTARIWNAATGETVRTLKGHNDYVTSAAFSPDSKWIVTGSQDNSARIWNAETGEAVRTLEGHDNIVTSVAFSPDSKWIVTGSYDNTARIWNAETGDAVRTLEGHDSYVTSAAFSPDGQWIVTGSYDYTARIWNAETGDAVRTLEGHDAEVNSATFSPDGQWIVTGSDDGTAKIWAMPDFLLADAETQVRQACEMLWKANAPLAFTRADIAIYPVLEGQPVDPDDPGKLLSPCRGILSEEAFTAAPAGP
ncbi:MAG: TIR domain-containing protein [Hyphomonas sp.]